VHAEMVPGQIVGGAIMVVAGRMGAEKSRGVVGCDAGSERTWTCPW